MNTLKTYIITIIVLLLHTASFGMKRQGDDIQTLDRKHIHKSVALPNHDKILTYYFDFITRLLSLHDIKGVNTEQLDPYDRILLLAQYNKTRKTVIDSAQIIRMNFLKTLPKDEVKAIIQNDMQKIYTNLYQNETNARKALIQRFNIDINSIPWRLDRLYSRDEVQNSIKLLEEKNYTTTWDMDLSPKIANMLEKEMKKKGIEPTSVNVFNVKKEYLLHCNALWKGPQQEFVECKDITSLEELAAYEQNPHKKAYIFKQIKPAFFAFNDKLISENDEKINFIIHHEIEHAIQGHNQDGISMVRDISTNAHVPQIDIYRSLEYAQWLLTHETIADTAFALQNPQMSHCALKYCTYPNGHGPLTVVAGHENMRNSTILKIKIKKEA